MSKASGVGAQPGLPRALLVTAGFRLAAYGTLRPGERNHRELVGCAGTWSGGFVRGHLVRAADPRFTPDLGGPAVAVQVLMSAGLPAHWSRLDVFEGDAYERVLVPVFDGDGRVRTVANLYAWRT